MPVTKAKNLNKKNCVFQKLMEHFDSRTIVWNHCPEPLSVNLGVHVF